MTLEVKVPTLPRETTHSTVSTVYVTQGQWVEKNERLLEVETNKVMLEIEADKAGTIDRCLVKEGDAVEVGQVLMLLRESTKQELNIRSQTTTVQQVDESPHKSLGLMFGVVGVIILVTMLWLM